MRVHTAVGFITIFINLYLTTSILAQTNDFVFDIVKDTFSPTIDARWVKQLRLNDFDNDGDLDVLCLYDSFTNFFNHESELVLHLNDGNGQFSENRRLLNEGNNSKPWMDIADYDNDGDIDILLADEEKSSNIRVFLNNGSGEFSVSDIGIFIELERFRSFNFQLQDIDNDGDQDLLSLGINDGFVQGFDNIPFWKNDGNGGFSFFHSGVPVPPRIYSFHDLNGDSYFDLIFGRQNNSPSYGINERNGQFSFFKEIQFPSGLPSQAVGVGDLNDDSRPDIIVGESIGTFYRPSDFEVWLALSTEDSFFTNTINFSNSESSIKDIELLDLDHDGDLDLLTAVDDIITAYSNDGSGNLVTANVVGLEASGEESRLSEMAIGDLDGNGTSDIVLATYFKSFSNDSIFPNIVLFNETPDVSLRNLPPAPNNFSSQVVDDIANISWDNPLETNGIENNVGYILKVWDSSQQILTFGSPQNPLNTPFCEIINLLANTYNYALKTVAPNKLISDWSSSATFTVTSIDTTAPAFIDSFSVQPYLPFQTLSKLQATVASSGSAAELRWQNPTDPDYVKTIIFRRDYFFPLSIEEGLKVYEGTREHAIDTTGIDEKKQYFYSAFALDEKGNISKLSDNSRAILTPVISDPPEIFHIPVGYAAVGNSLTLKVDILDDIDVRTTRIYYKNDIMSDFEFVDLTKEGIEFSGSIPESALNGSILNYYIFASDGQNNVFKPLGAPDSLFTVQILDYDYLITGRVYDFYSEAGLPGILIQTFPSDSLFSITASDSLGYYALPNPHGFLGFPRTILSSTSEGQYYSYQNSILSTDHNIVLNIPLLEVTQEYKSGRDFLDSFSDSFRRYRGEIKIGRERRFRLSVYFSTYDFEPSYFDSLKKALKMWEEATDINNLFYFTFERTPEADIIIDATDASQASGFAELGGRHLSVIDGISSRVTAHEVGHILGFNHPDRLGGGGIMYRSNEEISDYEANCVKVLQRVPQTQDRKPDLSVYQTPEIIQELVSASAMDSEWQTVIASVELGQPMYIEAVVTQSTQNSRSRESYLIIENLNQQQAITVPLLETASQSNTFRGIAFISEHLTDSPLEILASVGDSLAGFTQLGQRLFTVIVSHPTAVENLPTENVPARFALHQNYPNPFNPETTIEYEVPRRTDVSIKIYNLLGQRVTTLINEKQAAGHYKTQWDGKNKLGQFVSSGVYIYQIKAGDFLASRKLIILK